MKPHTPKIAINKAKEPVPLNSWWEYRRAVEVYNALSAEKRCKRLSAGDAKERKELYRRIRAFATKHKIIQVQEG